MIEMDYILDADAIRKECQRSDLLMDYTLSEWEMLMRLRIGSVEVFGHTEEEYQRWMADLKSNNISLNVPSSAWSLLSVLSIAVSVDSAFHHLREERHTEIDSLDSVIRLSRQDEMVTVSVSRDWFAQASYEELKMAFAAFAERVRQDFLALCPQLRDHVTLGSWFRGERGLSDSEKPQDVIYLPTT